MDYVVELGTNKANLGTTIIHRVIAATSPDLGAPIVLRDWLPVGPANETRNQDGERTGAYRISVPDDMLPAIVIVDTDDPPDRITDVRTVHPATSAPTGSIVQRIRFVDSVSGDPINGVDVTVRTDPGGAVVDRKRTDADGYADFGLEPNTDYTAIMGAMSGYTTTAATDFSTLAAGDVTTIQAVPLANPAPPAAGLRNVTGRVIGGDGLGDSGETVSAAAREGQYLDPDLVKKEVRSTVTDVDGRWALQLIQGVAYRFTVPTWDTQPTVTIPVGSEDITLASLLPTAS